MYQVQTMLVYYLKAHHPHIKKYIYFSHGCGAQYKNYKNVIDLSSHKHNFGIVLNRWFLQPAIANLCDDIGGAVKQYVAKRNL